MKKAPKEARMSGMSPEDVYELTGVADRLSPDGSQVAFVMWRMDLEASEYRSNIWLVPLMPKHRVLNPSWRTRRPLPRTPISRTRRR